MIDIILGILIGVAVAFVIFSYIKSRQTNDELAGKIKQALEEQFPKALRDASEHLMLLAKEKLVCIPDPFMLAIGFGKKVTVTPILLATCLHTNL